MMKRYKQLLTYIKSAVTRNYSEKSINSILDYISTSKQVSQLCVFHPLSQVGIEWTEKNYVTCTFIHDLLIDSFFYYNIFWSVSKICHMKTFHWNLLHMYYFMFCTIKVFLLLDNNLQDLFQRRTIQNNF